MLTGVDPRRWDLNAMLAAYESTLRQGAKDDASWKRTHSQLYAEPANVKRDRTAAARRPDGKPQAAAGAPRAGAMTLGSVEALLASMAAADAQYGQ